MLNLTAYLVKEHVAFMKLADTYDIFDPETGEQVGVAKEEPSGLVTFLRFFVNKALLPTYVFIYEHGDSRPVFSIYRGFSFLRSKVLIRDENEQTIGYFKSKLFSLGGGFYVYDKNDRQIADVKGDWKGWEFRFLTNDGDELGTVSKKWGGFAKEFFTSADNYLITLNPEFIDASTGINILLLAAGLAIDVIYKEGA